MPLPPPPKPIKLAIPEHHHTYIVAGLAEDAEFDPADEQWYRFQVIVKACTGCDEHYCIRVDTTRTADDVRYAHVGER